MLSDTVSRYAWKTRSQTVLLIINTVLLSEVEATEGHKGYPAEAQDPQERQKGEIEGEVQGKETEACLGDLRPQRLFPWCLLLVACCASARCRICGACGRFVWCTCDPSTVCRKGRFMLDLNMSNVAGGIARRQIALVGDLLRIFVTITVRITPDKHKSSTRAAGTRQSLAKILRSSVFSCLHILQPFRFPVLVPCLCRKMAGLMAGRFLLPPVLQGVCRIALVIGSFLVEPEVESEDEERTGAAGHKKPGRPKKGSSTTVKPTGRFGGQSRKAPDGSGWVWLSFFQEISSKIAGQKLIKCLCF